MRFVRYLNENISLSLIKKAIKKAIKEDPKRLGHGPSFWVMSNGEIIDNKQWKKRWKEILDDKDAIQFHSHSSSSGKDDKGFDTFSGGDIKMLKGLQQYGIDQIGLISAKGQMHILKGGSWSKKDERYEDRIEGERESGDKISILRNLAKKRGGELIISRWK
jgi:hypothetical protein